jgi:hypothetical protein
MTLVDNRFKSGRPGRTYTEANADNWTREKLAWAAGFMDGEGTFYSYVDTRRNPNKKLGTPSMTATQQVREPLDILQSMFGGNVYHSPNNTGLGGPVWRYQLYSREKVQAATAAMWPFLVVKREQARRTLANMWGNE